MIRMRTVVPPLLALLSLALLGGGRVRAAPMPPVLVANHETRQCAEIFAGDECMDCAPPAGWEILGAAGDVQCPAGYALVSDLEVICTPFQNEFCCSEGHSGAPGNCANLVVAGWLRECAFADDAADCDLPSGWTAGPAECPAGYSWVSSVSCTGDQDAGGLGLCPGAALVSPLLLAGLVLARKNEQISK